jgi:sirohydrochlorin ferrochelatase
MKLISRFMMVRGRAWARPGPNEESDMKLDRSLASTTRPAVGIALLALGAAGAQAAEPKIGVMLVNHGSRSAAWRASLLQVERNATQPLLRDGRVQAVKTAFMEYTEPSIATRMREFDEEGFSDVIILPVFLTVSSHTFDDIPTILGLKADPQSLHALKLEGIARYTPRARTHFGPRLDFSSLVQENVLRRARKLSRRPGTEGLVLIAYGDGTYERQWASLLEKTAAHVIAETGMGAFAYGWAGHVAHYDPAHTTRAVEQVLATRSRAVVVPVFVAFDEMFQAGVIAKGIARVPDHQRSVAYAADAILPDASVDTWVVATASEMAARIAERTVAASR